MNAIKVIKIFGDKYRIRETYDIDDSGIGIYGYEIHSDDGKFLQYFGGIKNLKMLKNYIKICFYRTYANCSR